MAYGLTNAKGASGAQAELIWSGTSSNVTIDYGDYSQLLICSDTASKLIDVPTASDMRFSLGAPSKTGVVDFYFCEATTNGTVTMLVSGEFYVNSFTFTQTFLGKFTKIYGIKEALV